MRRLIDVPRTGWDVIGRRGRKVSRLIRYTWHLACLVRLPRRPASTCLYTNYGKRRETRYCQATVAKRAHYVAYSTRALIMSSPPVFYLLWHNHICIAHTWDIGEQQQTTLIDSGVHCQYKQYLRIVNYKNLHISERVYRKDFIENLISLSTALQEKRKLLCFIST